MSSTISRLEMADGIKLTCELITCHFPVLPGLLVLIHGRMDTRHTGIIGQITRELQKSFNILSFDARGMGESEGVTSYRGAIEEAHDFKVIIDHFVAQGHSILALLGHSRGASIPGLCAELYGDSFPVNRIILVGGRFDTTGAPTSRFSDEQKSQLEEKGEFEWCRYRAGKWPERPEIRSYMIKRKDFESESYTLENAYSNLSADVVVLIVHGTADMPVPVANAFMTYDALGRAKAQRDLMVFDGFGHFFEKSGQIEALEELVKSWLVTRSKVVTKKVEGTLGDSGDRLRGMLVNIPMEYAPRTTTS